MVADISNEQAYEIVKLELPERVDSESKENGNKSGTLQVYQFEHKWFIRYLDVAIVYAFVLDNAIALMKTKLLRLEMQRLEKED